MTGVARAASLVVCTAAAALFPACGAEPFSPSDPVTEAFAAIAAGTLHSCGVTVSGVAYCWGWNADGEVGDGSQGDRPRPVLVATPVRFAAVASGGAHTCGRTSVGTALCWGLNQSGQVGVASTALRVLQPASVAGGLTLNQIGAGGAFNCGLAADSTAVCWGWNAYGQLGDSSRTDRSAPIPVVGGLRFTALTAGTWHTCGIVDDSSAYCWGRNANGQLGDGTTADTAGPVAVQGGLKFVALTAGSYHSCGLTAGGDAYCWGRGDFGQLGDSTNGSNTPDLVRGGRKFVAISAGAAHTCGLTSSNEAYCWGSGGSGQLGTSAALAVCQTSNAGSQPCSLVPVPVSGSLSFAALTTGFHHTCGVTTAGAGYCWGWNDHGQLGDGSGRASMVPVRVANQGAVP